MPNEEIGNRIKYARNLRGVTLDDIAKKVGVAKSTIQRYEAGKIATIKLPVVEAIAIALNVNPAWVVGKSDEMELQSQKIPKIMKYYEMLNEIGKNEATKRVMELTEIPRYKIDSAEIGKKTDMEISEIFTPHFTDPKKAREYLKSLKLLAAFGGKTDGLSDKDACIMANAIYSNNNRE